MDVQDLDLSGLSQEDLRKLAARVLSFVEKPEKGIGPDLFGAIIAVVPQTCIEAIVVDNIAQPNRILVTWRSDKHYLGWHFPGGYVRFGDNFEQTVRKVVKRELSRKTKGMKFTGTLTHNVDTRGHTLGAVFLVELDQEPEVGKWFNKVPFALLPHHKAFLKEVLGWK